MGGGNRTSPVGNVKLNNAVGSTVTGSGSSGTGNSSFLKPSSKPSRVMSNISSTASAPSALGASFKRGTTSKKRKGMMMMDMTEVKQKVTGMVTKEETATNLKKIEDEVRREKKKRKREDKAVEENERKRKREEERRNRKEEKDKVAKAGKKAEREGMGGEGGGKAKDSNKVGGGGEGGDTMAGSEKREHSEEGEKTQEAQEEGGAGQLANVKIPPIDFNATVVNSPSPKDGVAKEYWELLARANCLKEHDRGVLEMFFKGVGEGKGREGGIQRFKISECFRVVEGADGEKEKESDYVELDWGTGQYKLLRKTKRIKG
ncbi:hypothetical protein TrCOL_g5256 [Triparma columacea]|nr:hypothetical protein TrCOL_g5256 [Triparma columacea]